MAVEIATAVDTLPDVPRDALRPQPGNAQWIGARAYQEDAFGFAGFDARGRAESDTVLAVVADGMGGLAEGRAASQAAVTAFLAQYQARPLEEPLPDRLLAALLAANDAVHTLAKATAGEGQVGTTLVAAAIQAGQLWWVAAGDSRLYFYRAADGSLTSANEPHNYAHHLWSQVPSESPYPDWIDAHPDREALVSFLGLAEIPEIDRNLRPLSLAAGDRLLLCSDGVDGVLTPAELVAELPGPPQAAAEGLIARLQALARPAQDNATVAILAYGDGILPVTGVTRVTPPVAEPTRSKGKRRAWIKYAGLAVLLLLGLALGLKVGIGYWREHLGQAKPEPLVETKVEAKSESPLALPPAERPVVSGTPELASPIPAAAHDATGADAVHPPLPNPPPRGGRGKEPSGAQVSEGMDPAPNASTLNGVANP